MARVGAIIGLLLIVVAATGWQPAPVAAAPVAAPLQQTESPCAIAAATAVAQRGRSYVWGAKGPTAFDCSGLTYWAWLQAGRNIGVSTYDQAVQGRAIPCNLSHLAGAATTCWQLGDLAFLRYSGGQHVAMYVGNGLFADAYNPTAGIIIHNPASDPFYTANWWHARRIMACDGNETLPVPPIDTAPLLDTPGVEQLPDLIGPVSFAVSQCGDCDESGIPVLPAQEWSGAWPSSAWEWADLGRVFQIAMSWMAWQVSEVARQIICWMLAMLAVLARLLTLIANMLIYGINAVAKLLMLLVLQIRAYVYGFWEMLEIIRLWFWTFGEWFVWISAWGAVLLELLLILGGLLLMILATIGQIAMMLIGIIGWIGGLVIGVWIALLAAMQGTVVPAEINHTHIIYRATRGLFEGVIQSRVGWLIYLLWAMAYVSFVTWLARFLSVGSAGAAGGGGSRDA